jgi:hypothetical protein
MDLTATPQAKLGGVELQQRIEAGSAIDAGPSAPVGQRVDVGRAIAATGLPLGQTGQEQIELDPGPFQLLFQVRSDRRGTRD